MAVPARPVAGATVESAWGQVAHDTAVAMDIQTGRVTTIHTAQTVSPQVTVTFPRPFAAGSVPVVAFGCENFNYTAGMGGNPASATSFAIATRRGDNSAPTSNVVTSWIAYGPRA